MDITLKNKSGIAGTHWIEFNVSGTLGNYKHWADDSKYLDEYAYNLYTDIFEKVAKDFNYYGNTRFDKEQLIRLKQEIKDRINTVDNLITLQNIIEFSEKTSHSLHLTEAIETAYDKFDHQQKKLVSDIKKLGHDLIDLFDNCIKQDKTLIILGL
jgi:hypothetical protein